MSKPKTIAIISRTDNICHQMTTEIGENSNILYANKYPGSINCAESEHRPVSGLFSEWLHSKELADQAEHVLKSMSYVRC